MINKEEMTAQQIEYIDEIVKDVKSDFKARQEGRRQYDTIWQLNMNFVMGNQYCTVGSRGNITQEDKYFFWQEKQVFNHIAPIVDTRLARLSQVNPKPMVRPFGADDKDYYNASLCTKVLSSACETVKLNEQINQANIWSEICGTVFYKVGWDNNALVCGKLPMGDVTLTVCSPFEIYPDNNSVQDIDSCQSLIHARAYSVREIESKWGVLLDGKEVSVLNIDGKGGLGGLGYTATVGGVAYQNRKDSLIVIERYSMPTSLHPNGLLEIVAGDTLLYRGQLPYYIGTNNSLALPFIRQVCYQQPACFWGSSIVERCIPVQRAYNAVKNRKHEFLNRLTMGILTVEDGSVDTDNLQEEGLSPGKVLVYRQGANKPSMMTSGEMPIDFGEEEDRLLQEFGSITGVSEFASTSTIPTNVTSGVALQSVMQQDDTRLNSVIENIKGCIKEIGRAILRLYRQYSTVRRLSRICSDSGKVELYYYNSSDITSDDVVFEADSILNGSLANRRDIVMQLLEAGLLSDGNDKLDSGTKSKILSMIGFGNWEYAQSTAKMHTTRADNENIDIANACVYPVDDHLLHIEQHTRHIISDKASVEEIDMLLEHIAIHKEALGEQV